MTESFQGRCQSAQTFINFASMRILGNIIWLIFGGLITAFEYLVSSILMMITIVGIPFGIQTLKLAGLALWPFGKQVVTHDRSNGCLYIIFNVIWILVGGIWISLTHLLFGALLFITIIGIPFAKQHFKMASLALTPFGKDIVSR
ncbi:YccF domain-containing protein [Cryomorphaceae bacterium 1068]|nr:YccF domain-containing protein [Cryomorphaceae bacterium 1068]